MIRGYMTTQEAAEYLGVTRQHVAALARTGTLQSESIGRTLLIKQKSVVEYDQWFLRLRGRPPGCKDSQPRKKRGTAQRTKAKAKPQPTAPRSQPAGRPSRSIEI